MKKKILEALKNKYKNLGFGEKAFDGVAAYLEPSIKEEADIETVITGVEGLLKAFQSDTDQIRTARTAAEKKLSDYEAQVKKLGGAPVINKDEPIKGDDDKDTPAWAKVIIESNKKLADKLASMEGEKVTTTRKQKLDAIINKLPENMRKPYSRTPVKDISDEEFEALTVEIQKEVDCLATETTSKGAVFGRPATTGVQSQGTQKQASKEEVDAVVKGMNV